MYSLRQFRPTLYLLLLLGVSGYALASESPGLWILAVGGIGINAWLIKTRRFTPMPRLLANIVTIAGLLVVAEEVRLGDATPILTVGNFVVMLHIVKLFEQRANRDYAQLLILSLLLMVAAAISTASLLFGIIFIVYMFLSLHCCLLFHLKVELDQARQIYPQLAEQPNPAVLEREQKELPRSMRRLTALIAIVGLAMAVVVFLFFPRGSGPPLFSPLQAQAAQVLTGFSDQVTFQNVAQITRNDDVVARVELYHLHEKVTQPRELLLRGSALDTYTGNDPNRGHWVWIRSAELFAPPHPVDGGQPFFLGTGARGDWQQVITLEPTGTDKLFAMAGPAEIIPARDMNIRFSPSDDVLESGSILMRPITYTVSCSGELSDEPPSPDAVSRSVIDPAVASFARQASVCGEDSSGKPLADHPLAGDHAFDHQIASNIESYLRNHFTYTLDLTNEGSFHGRDPMAVFLTEFKKGHCEYFAGAMTLMCQSLGIPARFVVGFRCEPDSFNSIGDYFVVRQSDAHAWCEVYTGNGWETFDPTSNRQTDATGPRPLFSEVRKLLDFLEYKWANTIVAYDVGDRRNLIDSIDVQLSRTAVSGSQDWLDNFQAFHRKLNGLIDALVSANVLSGVITTMISLGFVALVWFMIERWRLHRRARRIGIQSLPTPDQLRLVRQLRFYNDLLRILQRHRIVRPRHMTPLEFSRSLSYLPAGVYNDVYRLTEMFYRIRYGSPMRSALPRRHLSAAVHRIQLALDTAYHSRRSRRRPAAAAS